MRAPLLVHTIESRHRLARERPETPLRRRTPPFRPRLAGGAMPPNPIRFEIFYPFRAAERNLISSFVNFIPSSLASRLRSRLLLRPGGMGEKSGSVGSSRTCLWVSVETGRERGTSKQISSGKKWLGRGQVVSLYRASSDLRSAVDHPG